MKRAAFVILLIFAQLAFAQTPEELQEAAALARELNLTSQSIVVVGSSIDAPERAMLELVKSRTPATLTPAYLDDSDATLALLEDEARRNIILVGGPSQNRISEEYCQRGWISNETKRAYMGFELKVGRTSKGAAILLVSDSRGFLNVKKEGVGASPLRFVVDEKYIPAAATGATISLMALLSIVRTALERFFLGLGRREKKIKAQAMKIFGIKVREAGSMLLASVVLAASITWVFTGPTPAFFPLLLINILVAMITVMGHELVHLVFGKMFGIRMEYMFWPAGSVFTLLSGYLGNPFGMAGFLVEEGDASMRRKIGLMKLSGPLASSLFALIFAAINVFAPWEIFQMVYTMASTLALVELLPFEPFDGISIRKWNVFTWFFVFCAVALLYIIINFIF